MSYTVKTLRSSDVWFIDEVHPRLVVASLSLAAIAGCSLLTDLSSLSSGGPLTDGGAVGDVATGTGEGGLGEAGPDAGGEGGAPGASGCARYPGATFCADFDGTNALAPPTWTENDALDPTPSGTISLTTTAPISAPNAARFELVKSMSTCRYLRLVKNLPGTFGGIVSRFDLRAEDPGVLFAMDVTVSPNLSFTILIALGVDKLIHLFAQQNLNGNIAEVGGENVDLDVPWAGRWIDLKLEYRSQPTKSVSLTVPGARTLVVALPATFVATDPRVMIGPFCTGTLTRATFDDVVTWAMP